MGKTSKRVPGATAGILYDAEPINQLFVDLSRSGLVPIQFAQQVLSSIIGGHIIESFLMHGKVPDDVLDKIDEFVIVFSKLFAMFAVNRGDSDSINGFYDENTAAYNERVDGLMRVADHPKPGETGGPEPGQCAHIWGIAPSLFMEMILTAAAHEIMTHAFMAARNPHPECGLPTIDGTDNMKAAIRWAQYTLSAYGYDFWANFYGSLIRDEKFDGLGMSEDEARQQMGEIQRQFIEHDVLDRKDAAYVDDNDTAAKPAPRASEFTRTVQDVLESFERGDDIDKAFFSEIVIDPDMKF